MTLYTVLWLTIRKAAWYDFVYLCLSVCQTITFESLVVGSSHLHTRYISREYGSCSYMKVVESSQCHRSKKRRKSRFPQCKTSIGNNSGSIKHRAMKFTWVFGYGGSNGVIAIFVK